MEATLAIIKPDALESGFKNDILHTIQQHKFIILKQGRFKLTRLRAEEFYSDFAHKAYFEDMIRYMMRRPIFVMVLSRGMGNCIQAFRNLLGPKDVSKARQTHPKSLRALYGTTSIFNGVHGSFSKEMSHKEIKFFFPAMPMEPYPNKDIANHYFESTIKSVLEKGLCMLLKKKPHDTVSACKFLGKWLHENNPNKYKVSDEEIQEKSPRPKLWKIYCPPRQDTKERDPCCEFSLFPPCARA